jgi:ParB family chromosome partitioning protein
MEKVEVIMEYQNVRLDQLNFSSTPVRLHRSGPFMQQLKTSLQATDGPVEPLILRDLGGREYIVVAGESRVRALLDLGYPPNYEVPALIGEFDDGQALEYGLVDNYVRAPLSAYEEALVVQSLISYYEVSQRQIALKLGKTEQHICRLLAVFDLIEEVRRALHEGEITLGHAVEFTPLKDAPEQQRRLLAEIGERSLSVRATRTRVRELTGEGGNWIIHPGEVWVSKHAKVSVYPGARGYQVDFSFTTADEFASILTVLQNRLSVAAE